MDAREVIQKAIHDCGQFKVQTYSDAVMQALSTAGFTIMSKEDVEAVRDKVLEEAASVAENYARRAMAATPSAQEGAAAAIRVAAAIRTLPLA